MTQGLVATFIFSPLIVLLSFLIIYRLWRRKPRNFNQWLIFVVPSVISALFVFFAAPWPYLDLYLRWVFLILYVIVLYRSFRQASILPRQGKVRVHTIFLRSALFLVMGYLLVLYFEGYSYPQRKAVELQFPFKGGNYYLMQGGGSRVTNAAHRNFSVRKYGYAQDIAAVNGWGSRIKGFMHSSLLEDYEIFHDTIYSPCKGIVIQLVDGVQNNPIGGYNRKEVHGNHIVIQADGYRIFMAHFQKGSFQVHLGQTIEVGQVIGLCGNSGFSSEPHLHLSAFRNYTKHKIVDFDISELVHKYPSGVNGIYDKYPYDGECVPIVFNGKFYSINDIIKGF